MSWCKELVIKRSFFIVLTFSIVFVIFAFIWIEARTFEKDSYAYLSNNIKTRYENLIHEKLKSVMVVALSLSKNQDIITYARGEHGKRLLLNNLSKAFRKDTIYKNLWIDIIDAHGQSVLHSQYFAKPYDNSYIEKFLNQPKTHSFIGVSDGVLGLINLAPIEDSDGEFLGFVKVVSHFNSIEKQLLRDKLDSIVLVNKEYSPALTGITTQIEGYKVANFSPNSAIMNFLSDRSVESIFQKSSYQRIDNYFVIHFDILDRFDKPIGHFIVFKHQDHILDFFKSNFTALFLMLFGLVLFIAYKFLQREGMYKKQSTFYKGILNIIPSIVLIYENKRLTFVNRSFYNVFNDVSSLNDFNNRYHDLGDFFIEDNGYLRKEVESVNWLDAITSDNQKSYRAKIEYNDIIYIFDVQAEMMDSGRYVVDLVDITELEYKRKSLQLEAITDSLTSIYNRRFFDEILKIDIEKAKEKNKNLSLLLFDVDFFKVVNDKHGHDVGDTVLIELSNIVKNDLREEDMFFRVGGEEFALILTNKSLKTAFKIAERIRKKVSMHNFTGVGSVTLSFGIANLEVSDDMKSFYKRADENLYEAKHSGRNRSVAKWEASKPLMRALAPIARSLASTTTA